MRRRSVIAFGLVALLAGCREEGGAKGDAASSEPPSTSAVEVPTIGDEVVTVDDTVPGESDGTEVAPATSPQEESAGDEEDPEEGCAPKEEGLRPMQVLKFTWTSGMEGKDPKDKLYVARPGQRVYAHLRMRNRSGKKRCLKLVFRIGDKKRTEVTLKIGKSWNWRTWAYNTIKPEDREPLRLTIHDDQGALVLDERLPVVPESK